MKKGFYYSLFKIGFPITIEHIVISSGTLLDNIMVSSLGTESVAAIGAIDKFLKIFWFIVFGISSAGSNFISQFSVKKEKNYLKNVLGIMLVINFIVAAIFTIISVIFSNSIVYSLTNIENVAKIAKQYLLIISAAYFLNIISVSISYALRGIGHTKDTVYSSFLFVFLNFSLNYLLIYGNYGFPKLGVAGAALGTVVAKLIECIFIISWVYYKKYEIAGNISEFLSFSKRLFNHVLKIAAPYGLSSGFYSMGLFVYQIAFGRLGLHSMAAYAITSILDTILMDMFHGLSGGTLILVGRSIGEKENEKSYTNAKKSLKAALFLSLPLGLVILVFANKIVNLYSIFASSLTGTSLSQESLLITISMIKILGSLLFLKILNLVFLYGILGSGGDSLALLAIENGSIWLIGIPIILIFSSLNRSPQLIYIALYSEEVAKFILLLKRFRSKKWIRDLSSYL